MFVLLTPPGRLQGLLQKLLLLEPALFFLLHLPEAEHRLLRGQGFVKQHPHVDPSVGIPKQPPEISAEIPHPFGHQAADALKRETVHILLVGLRLNHFFHGVQKSLIIPRLGNAAPHIVGALDHLISASGKIHPVQGKVGISQHPHRLVGPLDLRV